MTDTIFATSTGAPPAAIAIIRVSGHDAMDAATAIAGPLPEARRAVLRTLRDGAGDVLDRALVLVFPGPHTATGEDVVELHVHGGRAVIAAIEAVLAARPGLRRAAPGEFTRRALLNGIIDLTEAEGLGDLLRAETEAQRRAALQIAEGGLRRQIARWTGRLVHVAAHLEALIDFSDEDDVADVSLDQVGRALRAVADEIDGVLAQPPVERVKDGIRVVLAGPPNSGKSTLLNALVGYEAAIVSPLAGTTRDRIEVPVSRKGVAYVLSDTAGLNDDSRDPIERIGIERAEAAIAGADILLWLGDTAAPQPNAVRVHSRCDVPGREHSATADVIVSAATGMGLATLWDLISGKTATLLPVQTVLPTNARQRDHLKRCRTCLTDAAFASEIVLAADDVRRALLELETVGGGGRIDDVLDVIFADFCIGK